jgi:phosphatidate cytidylyltransferase
LNRTADTAKLGRAVQGAGFVAGAKPLRFSMDWVTRPLFGIVLAAIATAATLAGGFWFASFIGIGAIVAAYEWHRMVARKLFIRPSFITALTIIGVLYAMLAQPHSTFAWTILAIGMAGNFLVGLAQDTPPAWQLGGTFYLGAAVLAMMALRILAPHGSILVLGMLLAVWATDTGALVFGNLIGGPKLWPALSPNKTWAGFFGGLVTAAIIAAVYASALGMPVIRGAIFGAGISVVASAGDMFESWAKRMFRIKDSGGLIPGHGGVLDRIDSTLLAAIALATLVLVAGIDPLFGAHP